MSCAVSSDTTSENQCAAGGDRNSVNPLDVSLEPVLLRSPFFVPDRVSADRTSEIHTQYARWHWVCTLNSNMIGPFLFMRQNS